MIHGVLMGNQLISDWQRHAQEYANQSRQAYSDYYRAPREMTAEDLGVRLPIDDDGLIDFTFGQYDLMFEHRWGRIFTDAPYAFWLGGSAAEKMLPRPCEHEYPEWRMFLTFRCCNKCGKRDPSR